PIITKKQPEICCWSFKSQCSSASIILTKIPVKCTLTVGKRWLVGTIALEIYDILLRSTSPTSDPRWVIWVAQNSWETKSKSKEVNSMNGTATSLTVYSKPKKKLIIPLNSMQTSNQGM